MSDTVIPIPSDIPLPLPLPAPLLTGLLILFFVVHILFVNLMLGGSLLTFVFELAGLRRPRFDAIAHEIAKTITVTKSLAVVLGVGPLLGSTCSTPSRSTPPTGSQARSGC
jgi:cytochrome c